MTKLTRSGSSTPPPARRGPASRSSDPRRPPTSSKTWPAGCKTDTGRQTRRGFHASQVLDRGDALAHQVKRTNEGGDTEGSILVNNWMTGECGVIVR